MYKLASFVKRIRMNNRKIRAAVISGFMIGLTVFSTSFMAKEVKEKPLAKLNGPLKHIYLTFDDGPLNGSENIDSVILGERLKVSVFLVGEHAEESRRLGTYYKLYEENPFVEVYNHSYTHANDKYAFFYRNPQNVLADIQRNEQYLHLRYKIVRLPGRNMWRIGNRKRDDGVSGAAAADLLMKTGYKIYGWDLEWQHQGKDGTPVQSVAAILKEIETRLESGNTFTKDNIVVLIHDEMFEKPWEESELKQLIDKLRLHENYLFENIRFYPEK
jgi:peptidoglycan/xylan/chitin deacetylase (PgdA/CDA1 family)